jgi:hypothetical protein
MSTKRKPTKCRHHALALEIARGRTLADAAKKTGYSYDHVRRLNCRPAFKRLVMRLRGELTKKLTGRLVDAGDVFVDAIVALAKAKKHDSVRLGAAKAGLDLLLRYRDASEMDELAQKVQKQLRQRCGVTGTMEANI